MRITAAEKEATRERILESALDLFRRQGFEVTTTRDIARVADIATGTLFNYFETKEAIVASLADEAVVKAHRDFERRAVTGDLEEQLFALIAGELRQLKPLRKFLAPILERSFNPLAKHNGERQDAQTVHLEQIAAIARRSGVDELSPMALQLYWTLYTGVLAFWASDSSPKQEDTLALLDQSLSMFVSWLRSESAR